MEESKEIQQIYKIFRTTVYIMLILEFLVYVPFPFIEPGTLFHTIVGKIARFGIYDNLIYSRLAIILMVCVTCIGTKAKKDLEFDPQRHVAVPFISGLIITILSVWMYRMVIDYPLFGIGTNYTLNWDKLHTHFLQMGQITHFQNRKWDRLHTIFVYIYKIREFGSK